MKSNCQLLQILIIYSLVLGNSRGTYLIRAVYHPKESECFLHFLPPTFSTKREKRRNIATVMQQLLDIPTILVRVASNASMRSTMSAQRKIAELQDRVPIPSHRHAAPSGPWPWIDLEDGTYRTHRTLTVVRDSLLSVSSHCRGGRETTRKGGLHSFSLPTWWFMQQLLERVPSVSLPKLDRTTGSQKQNPPCHSLLSERIVYLSPRWCWF